MPKTTIDSLREININDRGSFITISLVALRNSIEIYHTFMDYNALSHKWTRSGRVIDRRAGRTHMNELIN